MGFTVQASGPLSSSRKDAAYEEGQGEGDSFAQRGSLASKGKSMKISAVISVDELTRQGADWAPLADMLARLRAWGYDGVELGVRDPAHLDVAALQRVLSGAGLPVAALATGTAYTVDNLAYAHPDPTVRRAAMQRVSAHCRLAARIGGPVIIGLIRGRVPPGIPAAQAMTWVREGLAAACEAGGRLGVSLLFEPINRYESDMVNTVEEGIALVDSLGAANLGLLLDTFHMNIEEPAPCQSLLSAGHRLHHVHTADSNRWYPGAGHVDFFPIVATLREMGYTGYLSAEILPRPDLATSLERAGAALRRLVPAP